MLQKNVLEYLEHSTARFPDKTAFSDETETFSFSRMLACARSLGTALAGLSPRHNGPVAVLVDHSAANLTAFMGVLYSGNFYVPVDSQMPPPRMKAMTSKQWLALFCATVLCLGACVVGFNWLADPFGVFTHKALEWPSYEMTLNPRTAKITYLKEHHQEYDSYILGCSSTSSFPTEQLNEYLDASFYNMIMYGADMLDVEQDAVYLLENYEVKNLVVNVYLDNACVYDQVTNPLSYSMPPETTGESSLSFYARYLFMDPRHSLDKLKAMGEDTYLTQSFDVFNEVTGAYDKKVRDAEAIGSLEQYYESYPIFADYPEAACFTDEDAITGTLESLTRIRDLCQEKGVNLLVLCAPVYADYWDYFDFDQVADFYTRLAQVTDYWDFSYSSVSFEPRYFYDETHFRNCVGEMALARVFGDDSVYIPQDFGVYVTADNVSSHIQDLRAAQPQAEESCTAQVPVFLYHQIDPQAEGDISITPEHFEAQIAALAEAGYTAVLESGQARENILRWERESEDAYRQVLSQDCGLIREAITQGTGEDQVHVLAYPNGQLDPLAQVTLLENGFDILFTTQASCNTLLKGQPQSLLGLGRYNMNQAVSVEQTLEWASDARG